MSGGAIPPRCLRCGVWTYDIRRNTLIGGTYCAPCDAHITAPAPTLEERYNRRVALRATSHLGPPDFVIINKTRGQGQTA